MMRIRLCSLLFSAILLVLAGCGGGSMTSPPPPGSSLVSLTVTDTPPAGITLLSFQVSITGAALSPGNVDLLAGKGPVRIEVKRLETDSAFLNTASVAPGTYTSLKLTFANPELTFKNDTSATLAGCAAGVVCEIKPTGTLTATFTFPTPGITISTSSPTGLQVDINPNAILSSALGVDFSQTGAVRAQQFTACRKERTRQGRTKGRRAEPGHQQQKIQPAHVHRGFLHNHRQQYGV